jgi:hypothetical protein
LLVLAGFYVPAINVLFTNGWGCRVKPGMTLTTRSLVVNDMLSLSNWYKTASPHIKNEAGFATGLVLLLEQQYALFRFYANGDLPVFFPFFVRSSGIGLGKFRAITFCTVNLRFVTAIGNNCIHYHGGT